MLHGNVTPVIDASRSQGEENALHAQLLSQPALLTATLQDSSGATSTDGQERQRNQ